MVFVVKFDTLIMKLHLKYFNATSEQMFEVCACKPLTIC